MKHFLAIGLFLFAFAACTSKVKVPELVEGPSPELSAIDSLLWHQPDSALIRLLPYFDTCTPTEYDRHYAHLLLSELLYKNDYPQTNRTELLQAVGYFDSLTVLTDTRGVSRQPRLGRAARRTSAQNIAFFDARAHYINGVGYYENDSVVEACKEYMKALDVMEERLEEKDLVGHKVQFMGLTYTRLSTLFSDMYLHEQAIYFAKLFLTSNQKVDIPDWHIARMLCEIGVQYNLLEQLDSADYYYESAAKVLNDTNCLLYKDITTQQILLSYKKSGSGKNTLNRLHRLINQSNSETEYFLRCFNIGGVFYQEKQLDSAWYYLNKVYSNTQSLAVKKQAAEWLVEICRAQRKDDEILEYASYLVPFANQEENQSEVKSQLTELYNSYRQKDLSRQHQKMVRKNTTIGLAIIGGLIVGLLVYVILFHYNRTLVSTKNGRFKFECLT